MPFLGKGMREMSCNQSLHLRMPSCLCCEGSERGSPGVRDPGKSLAKSDREGLVIKTE